MSTNDMNSDIKKHTISLHVSNKPGVLIRIALVFSRRGFNIDSLSVSESADTHFSRMNIVATGDSKNFDQILKQLNKLVDVIHAKDNTGTDIIETELALLKIKCTDETRAEILQVSHAFGCETMNLSENTIDLRMADKSEKIDDANKIFSKYGIIELIRTGKIFIARGDEHTA